MECPITHELFEDPVLIPCCGNSFERDAISLWLENHVTCPMCRHPIPGFEPLIEPANMALLRICDEHRSTTSTQIIRPDDTSPSTWKRIDRIDGILKIAKLKKIFRRRHRRSSIIL